MKEMVIVTTLFGFLLLVVPSNIHAEVLVGNIKFTDDGKIVFVDNSEQSTATLQGPQGPQGPQGVSGTPGSAVTKDAICLVYADNNLQPPPFCGKKTIFLSSASFDGNLGGLAGADEKCQTAALTAGLTGTYKAWISDSVTAVKDRLAHSSVPYVSTIGAVIANNWNDLTDGSLKDPVVCDENKQCNYVDVVAYWIPTWSNSTSDGSRDRDANAANPTPYDTTNCLNWTTNSNTSIGYNGNATEIDAGWTSYNSSSCDLLRPLICVEQ